MSTRRALLFISVTHFGHANAFAQARLGKKNYSFDWDSTGVKRGEELSHILSIAELVRDTVQMDLPRGQTAELDRDPVAIPESFQHPNACWGFIFYIHDQK